VIDNEVVSMVDKLVAWQPVAVDKWLDRAHR
jgi:hypothetical protein